MRVQFYTPFGPEIIVLPDCADEWDVVRRAKEIGAVMYTILEDGHVDDTDVVSGVERVVQPGVRGVRADDGGEAGR